jgi:UDP-N-acetylmuramate dehydrogenase
MNEGVILAPFTTFKIGGEAQSFIEVRTEEELLHTSAQSFAILGGGSNVLVPEEGIAGLVIKVSIPGIVLEDLGDHVRVYVGAGVSWNEVVDAAGEHSLWGIENLAGIPGTVGGAAVQNIGAYGAELATVFEYADAIDFVTHAIVRITKAEANFGYRDSLFKHRRDLAISRVVLVLKKVGQPNLTYKDLKIAAEKGTSLSTPGEIAGVVRAIRAQKFPDLSKEGTAGSFFKNPVASPTAAASLAARYPGIPEFPQSDGTVKISLAWLLDNVLHLKGLSRGKARLFERQPLVIVASPGATALDIEQLAQEVENRVLAATDIKIEREVENFSLQKLSTRRS